MPISKTIKFVHDGRIVEVRNPDSNQTLLDFIRTNLNKKGSKSGCDEAACGACIVVVGTLSKDDIKYRAVNSCIFLLYWYYPGMTLDYITTTKINILFEKSQSSRDDDFFKNYYY